MLPVFIKYQDLRIFTLYHKYIFFRYYPYIFLAEMMVAVFLVLWHNYIMSAE